MATENYYQRRLADQLKDEGAYVSKWATELLVGRPDLIIVSGGETTFCEMKMLRDLRRGQPFDRKLGLTERQHVELCKLRRAGAVVVIAVVCVWRDNQHPGLALIPFDEYDGRLTADSEHLALDWRHVPVRQVLHRLHNPNRRNDNND